MGIYMCMKSGCRVSGEDFARSKTTVKASAFTVYLLSAICAGLEDRISMSGKEMPL